MGGIKRKRQILPGPLFSALIIEAEFRNEVNLCAKVDFSFSCQLSIGPFHHILGLDPPEVLRVGRRIENKVVQMLLIVLNHLQTHCALRQE